MSNNNREAEVFEKMFSEVRQTLTPPVGLKEAVQARVFRQDDTPQPVSRPNVWRRVVRPRWIAAAAVAACAAVAVIAWWYLSLFGEPASEPVHERLARVPVTPPAVDSRADTARTAPDSNRVTQLRVPTTEQLVVEAKVIVVGTPLDFAPVPPNVQGDAPEVAVRYRVTRILKGELADGVITIRRAGAGLDEHFGKEWILFLSPEYLAGKYPFAGCTMNVKSEPEAKAAIATEAKVAAAEVIVVGTPLDFAPVPPNVEGNAPEVAVRYRVTRTLKGELADEVITIQQPNAPVGVGVDELAGKEWILFLSPEYLYGQSPYAGCQNVKGEREVKTTIKCEGMKARAEKAGQPLTDL